MWQPVIFWHLIALTLVQQLSPIGQVQGQYIQGCQAVPNKAGGIDLVYQPSANEPAKQCVSLETNAVFLEYNCFYMRDICRNAENFMKSPRGVQFFTRSTSFGYDYNTGKKGRSAKRREQSCPTGKSNGWIIGHKCPETDQNEIWRHDGPWPYKALEDPANDPKTIKHERDSNGNIVRKSKIRYSCDEFPPATWVEGGNGAGLTGNVPSGGNAFTRCAAIRCAKGTKAEQDWQGSSHGRLRQLLKKLVQDANKASPNNPPYPHFDPTNSIVFFNFRMTNERHSGIAAKIYTYTDLSATTIQGLIGIPQNKRSLADQQKLFADWKNTVTMEELVKMDNVSQHFIFTNETEFVSAGVPNSFNYNSTLDFEEQVEDEDLEGETELDGEFARNSSSALTHHTPPTVRTKSGTLSALMARLHIRGSIRRTNSTLPAGNSTAEINRARQIFKRALAKSIELNNARLANPRRNHYGKPGYSVTTSSNRTMKRIVRRDEEHPLLALTDELVDAAALLSELDAEPLGNLTKRQSGPGGYWMGQLARKGTVPWGNDPSYKVFRNVRDYGAVGDGKIDDTKAIKRAMNDGRRCGEKCNGSTTKNAIVYFPPGTYRVSSTIPLPFGTQVIGDAGNWPTILAAPSFLGLGVLSTDEYTGGGKGLDGGDEQYYVNTANFYRQIRNLRIDVSLTDSAQKAACLHYQVAQATSIQNVELIAAPGSSQQGIFAENGSGGVISDITFRGGKFGIYGGNQQFTAQRLTFDGCETGIQIIWDWGWIWKSIHMKNVQTGFRLLQESPNSGHIGSVSVIDSSFQGVGTAILVAPLNSKTGSGSTGVIVENVQFSGVDKAVADTSGAVLLVPSPKVDHWVVGPVYSADGTRQFSTGGKDNAGFHRQRVLLDSNGAYLERSKPQYEDRGVGDFVHVKDFGAKGDGSSDDTAAFQSALYASQGKILFIDAGSYILTSTVVVPPGSKIVGEAWSQLVASGAYFSDANNPKVMLQVGKDGDEGSMEMQDLIFTNRGPTAGLVLVEWNINADSPGSAALWDCHVRIGGATGTQLTPAECPPSTTGINPRCNAASLMMHITPKASGYFENMWLWVADHMIDDPDLDSASNEMTQTSIYVARGLLIESTDPVWLYGTSSEHSVYYQYNFHNAHTIFAGMIQTESPYYQPTPPPPAPFDKQVGLFPGDPTYNCGVGDELSGCDESWAVIMRGSSNIFIAGAGLYSWFSTYKQDCIDGQTCQKVLMLLDNNQYNVRIQQLITIGAKYMAVQNGKGIAALDNLNVDTHPRWSQVSVFDVSTNHSKSANDIWIDPKIWDMANPRFTCTSPCMAVLPPWKSATEVIDYPLVTVSSGTWTSTITLPPMTVSEWVFRKITAQPTGLMARDGEATMTVMPRLEPSKAWAPISYAGPDGLYTTVTPTPTKPPVLAASFGPDAKSPYEGSWPKAPVTIILRDDERGPFVDECSFTNQQGYCDMNLDMWTYFWGTIVPPWRQWVYDETGPEDRGPCPPTLDPTSKPPVVDGKPTVAPLPEPSPHANSVSCSNYGDKFLHREMDAAIESFCLHVGKPGDFLDPDTYLSLKEVVRKEYTAWHGRLGVSVPSKSLKFTLAIKSHCRWRVDFGDCKRYFTKTLDGCNCGGVDGKQGGTLNNNCLMAAISPEGAKPVPVDHDEL